MSAPITFRYVEPSSGQGFSWRAVVPSDSPADSTVRVALNGISATRGGVPSPIELRLANITRGTTGEARATITGSSGHLVLTITAQPGDVLTVGQPNFNIGSSRGSLWIEGVAAAILPGAVATGDQTPTLTTALSVDQNEAARNDTVAFTWAVDGGPGVLSVLEYQRPDESWWREALRRTSSTVAKTWVEEFQLGSIDGGHRFRVRALNAFGEITSDIITVTVAESPSLRPPTPPTALAGSMSASTTATWTWSPPASVGSGPISDYELEHRRDGGTWTDVPIVSSTTYSRLLGTNFGDQEVRVRAINAIGPSPWTVPVSVLYGIPTAPSGLSVGAAPSGVDDPNAREVAWNAPSSSNASPIDRYEVEVLLDGVVVDVTATDGPRSTVIYIDQSDTYVFRVRARNRLGFGPWSGEFSFAVTVSGYQSPVNTVKGSISGGPNVGDTITAVPGTWTGDPTPTIEYVFSYIDDDGLTVLQGTASTAYVIQEADAGKTIIVIERAMNTPSDSYSSTLGEVAVPAVAPGTELVLETSDKGRADGYANSYGVTMPVLAPGDGVLVMVTAQLTSAVIAAPAGWTKLGERTAGAGTQGFLTAALFWSTSATSGETVTFNTASVCRWTHTIASVSGQSEAPTAAFSLDTSDTSTAAREIPAVSIDSPGLALRWFVNRTNGQPAVPYGLSLAQFTRGPDDGFNSQYLYRDDDESIESVQITPPQATPTITATAAFSGVAATDVVATVPADPLVRDTATTSPSGYATSLALDLPVAIEDGDMIFASVTARSNEGSMVFPADWTILANYPGDSAYWNVTYAWTTAYGSADAGGTVALTHPGGAQWTGITASLKDVIAPILAITKDITYTSGTKVLPAVTGDEGATLRSYHVRGSATVGPAAPTGTSLLRSVIPPDTNGPSQQLYLDTDASQEALDIETDTAQTMYMATVLFPSATVGSGSGGGGPVPGVTAGGYNYAGGASRDSTTMPVRPLPNLSLIGAINVPPGSDIQTLTDSNPAGTVFHVRNGTHTDWSYVLPKAGNRYIGESEAGVIIQGDSGRQCAVKSRVGNVVIANMTFKGYGDSGASWTTRQFYGVIDGHQNATPVTYSYVNTVTSANHAKDWHVHNCTFDRTNNVPGVWFSSRMTVTDSVFDMLNPCGITGSGGVGGLIQGCSFLRCGASGAPSATSNNAAIKMSIWNLGPWGDPARDSTPWNQQQLEPIETFRVYGSTFDGDSRQSQRGVWFDVDFRNGDVSWNTMVDLADSALFVEVSNGVAARYNEITNCGSIGAYDFNTIDGHTAKNAYLSYGALSTGSGTNVILESNTLNDCPVSIQFFLGERGRNGGDFGPPDGGAEKGRAQYTLEPIAPGDRSSMGANDLIARNNVLTGTSKYVGYVLQEGIIYGTESNHQTVYFVGNTYPSGIGTTFVWDKSRQTLAQWQAAGRQ